MRIGATMLIAMKSTLANTVTRKSVMVVLNINLSIQDIEKQELWFKSKIRYLMATESQKLNNNNNKIKLLQEKKWLLNHDKDQRL